MKENSRMIPHGRHDLWLTLAVVAMLVGEGIRTRWRRVVALMTAVAALHRPAMRTNLRQGCDGLTADDKRRLAARAGRALREENHGDAGS